MNQIEVHPRFNQPGNRAFCAANGVAVEAYSPLGHGKDIESEPVVAAAKAHDVTPAQVVLRWHTQEGRIIIPKSKHVERMRVNLASSDFDLTSAELAAIDALDDPHDNVSARSGDLHAFPVVGRPARARQYLIVAGRGGRRDHPQSAAAWSMGEM